MVEPIFSLDKISYSYPGKIPALSNITLKIKKGERTAFIGANGTGKSTLLSIMDGLIHPETGTLKAFGDIVNEKRMNDQAFQKQFRKRTGYVFQNPDIQLFCPTVREDILFGPSQLGIPQEIALERFKLITEEMRISHLLDRMPHQLSIGEKKKASIVSILILEPEVLLLDEPTAGLDPWTQREIIDILDRLHKNGITVVMATHDLHIVGEMADIVHVFGEDHTIIRSGKTGRILADLDFLKKHNLAHIHKHEHHGLVHRHPHTH